MRSYSHLNTTFTIIETYDGLTPLALYLKEFFRSQKKFGAKDRREIAALCFSYYRLGDAFLSVDIKERILLARFLCSQIPSSAVAELKPEWNSRIGLSVQEKFAMLGDIKEVLNICPFLSLLSTRIEGFKFSLSFAAQPHLFVRLRKEKKRQVMNKLHTRQIGFILIGDDCIQLANSSKIEDIFLLDTEVVIQDLNSQKVLKSLEQYFTANTEFQAWDSCAASGGKSILLRDQFPNAQITVSDVRPGILHNLENRFRRAGITNYRSLVLDLSKDIQLKDKYDLIICDAPCSGSGTWSRTPEQMKFFSEEKLQHYSGLQKKIVTNASRQLKENGLFLYITCSVFKKENEDVVDHIANSTGLLLQEMHYHKGYDKRADTLFTALFVKA